MQLPFEFQEVLLSPKERAKVQNGFIADSLFSSEESTLIVREYRLRPRSIRLRTINNACGAMFTLPDGTPVTEVNIYGSRESPYVIGPYKAVIHLMGGGALIANAAHKEIEAAHQKVRLCLDGLRQIRNDVVAKSGLVRCQFNNQTHQFQPSDLPLIDRFISHLDTGTVFTDLDALLKQAAGKPWWWPWTEEHSVLRKQCADLMGPFNDDLKVFLIDLYPELQGKSGR